MSLDFNVSLWVVLLATVAQFFVGAIWYMPIFGNMWGKIHGFANQDKKTQKEMQKQMMPMMVIQLLVTFLTAFVLGVLVKSLPDASTYMLAFWVWLGFVVPTQVAAVIFGGTDPKSMTQKIGIMVGGSLACLEAAALIFNYVS